MDIQVTFMLTKHTARWGSHISLCDLMRTTIFSVMKNYNKTPALPIKDYNKIPALHQAHQLP